MAVVEHWWLHPADGVHGPKDGSFLHPESSSLSSAIFLKVNSSTELRGMLGDRTVNRNTELRGMLGDRTVSLECYSSIHTQAPAAPVIWHSAVCSVHMKEATLLNPAQQTDCGH
ncbi:hypothetical protein INR49_027730 [Caranx melampygus]|nr:hypothetical protein INR49_027730 [Caranx melampygus]